MEKNTHAGHFDLPTPRSARCALQNTKTNRVKMEKYFEQVSRRREILEFRRLVGGCCTITRPFFFVCFSCAYGFRWKHVRILFGRTHEPLEGASALFIVCSFGVDRTGVCVSVCIPDPIQSTSVKDSHVFFFLCVLKPDNPPYVVYFASHHECEKRVVLSRGSFLNFGFLKRGTTAVFLGVCSLEWK